MATTRAGKRPKNGRDRANRPSAENGRADAAEIAPLASQRPFRPGKCQHRPKRKPGDSRGVKIENAPLYVDKWI